jgi:hypothetical protein
MVFRITNETKYAISGTRSTEENKAVVFKNIKGTIIGENTENIKINNGVDICNETKKGSIILKTSSTSEIDQTLIFPPVAATPGENQILQNDGTGQLSWVSHGGSGESTGDVTGPNSSEDMTVAIYNGGTGKSIKNTNVTIDTNNNLSTTGTIRGATGSTFGNLTLSNGSIRDSNGSIDFENNNLTTTGHIHTSRIFSDALEITKTDGVPYLYFTNKNNYIYRISGGTSSNDFIISKYSDPDSEEGSCEWFVYDESLARLQFKLGKGQANEKTFILGTATFGTHSGKQFLATEGDDLLLGNSASNLKNLIAGNISASSGSTFGNLTLANGSITDSDGSIGFGNNNLSTTGTISATAGAKIGNLTLENGSITDSDGAIDFGNNNLSTTGTISVAGQVCFSAALTPATITGDEDNYDPVNLNSSNFLRLGTDGGNYTISGITAPNPPTNQLLFVCNVGTSGKLQLLDDNSNSNDVNRFLLGSTKTIKNNEGILLIYDVLSSRWRSASM